MADVLRVQALGVNYGTQSVLQNIQFSVSAGSRVAVVGPNGAGKSTLIKAILQLVPHSGSTQFWGSSLDANRKRIAYIPQRESIDLEFPLTIEDLVLMGRFASLGFFKRVSQQDRQLCEEAMELLGIASLKKKSIAQVSGGELQRAFIARALCSSADLHLWDEPLKGIDAASEEHILKTLPQLSKSGKTLLMIHHDLKRVRECFDRVLVVRQTLVADGTPQEVLLPSLFESVWLRGSSSP